MILTVRELREPSLGIRLWNGWILHRRYRVLISAGDGVQWDDQVFPVLPAQVGGTRSFLRVVLRGSATVRYADGRHDTLAAGDVIVGRGNYVLRCAQRSLMLSITWEPGSLADGDDLGSSFRLSRADLARAMVVVRETADCVHRDDAARAERSLASLFEILASSGARLQPESVAALSERASAGLARVARVLSAAASNLRTQPMMIDLSNMLGLGEKQTARLIASFAQTYSFEEPHWQQNVHHWRIRTGLLLMSAPSARTEAVAALAGFGSPSALCHAFAVEGLPSPGEIRGALRRRA